MLILCLTVQISCADKIDWSMTFDSNDKIPYGTYVLRNELESIFPEVEITDINTPTYTYLSENQYDLYHENYIFIYNYFPHPIEAQHEIDIFVENGGTAFISNHSNSAFLEKKGIKIAHKTLGNDDDVQNLSLSIIKQGHEMKYDFQNNRNIAYFSEFDTETTEILGHVYFQGKKEPNYLKVNIEDGYFLLHATPIVFTNDYLLKKGQSLYVADVFSYLENHDILWDNQRIKRVFSSGNSQGNFFNALSFFMQHQALKTALLLFMLLGLLYLLFNYKRKQRVLPIILPYENYTLNFTKTLSEVYRNHSDHRAMVRYKINYFLEQTRQRYQLSSNDFDQNFAEILSKKSGVNLLICQQIAEKITHLKNKEKCRKEDLLQLHHLLTKFNNESK